MEQKETRRGKTFSVHLPVDVCEKVDYLATMADISRSKLLANIVEVGIDELMTLDKLGVVRFTLLLRDFRDNFKAHLAGIEKKAVA